MSEFIPKTFKERQQLYMERWGKPYPYSWKRNFDQIIAVFKLLQFSNIQTVVELGCNDGGLAVECLRELPYSLVWTGYDIVPQHIERSRYHPNYKSILLEKYLWEMDDVKPFDVFVASHVLEHMHPEEIQALAQWLSLRAKYLILIAPLGVLATSSSTPEHTKRSGHILTKGSIWVSDVLLSFGFKPVWQTTKWFGWFKKDVKNEAYF